jgi:hypothetical protein
MFQGQDVLPPIGCWEQLQVVFPAVKQRLVPLAELGSFRGLGMSRIRILHYI